LIDPCADEPLDYFWFDFTTGDVAINPAAPFKRRAKVTKDMFGLDREPLRDERRKKLLQVLYLLGKVLEETPVTQETQDALQRELEPNRPWLAILRQLFSYVTVYDKLVEDAKAKLPEIEDWIEDWI
jgi:hypothetical protein